MTSLSAKLRDAFHAGAHALRGVVSIHVFGSSLYQEAPGELDLLVVYDPEEIPPRRAAALREAVGQACAGRRRHAGRHRVADPNGREGNRLCPARAGNPRVRTTRVAS